MPDYTLSEWAAILILIPLTALLMVGLVYGAVNLTKQLIALIQACDAALFMKHEFYVVDTGGALDWLDNNVPYRHHSVYVYPQYVFPSDIWGGPIIRVRMRREQDATIFRLMFGSDILTKQMRTDYPGPS